jgi:hypothetical protein
MLVGEANASNLQNNPDAAVIYILKNSISADSLSFAHLPG